MLAIARAAAIRADDNAHDYLGAAPGIAPAFGNRKIAGNCRSCPRYAPAWSPPRRRDPLPRFPLPVPGPLPGRAGTFARLAAPDRSAVPVEDARGRAASSLSSIGAEGRVTGWANGLASRIALRALTSGSGRFSGGGGSGGVVTVNAETTSALTEAVKSGASARASP